MKTIYAAFERVENAKSAVGRVKKESWNQAGLMVISPGTESMTENDANQFEFGNEHFLETPYSRKISEWPALQDNEINGIGKVKMAVNLKPEAVRKESQEPIMMNKELIADGLKKNKVIAIIEADDEIISKIETILESEGADITIFEENREEL